MGRLNRLPVRVRVTLVFMGAMAVVLVGVGLFLFIRLGHVLSATTDVGLRAHAADVETLIDARAPAASSGGSLLTQQGEGVAQILSRTGRVLDSTPQAGTAPLLSAAQRRQLTGARTFLTVGADASRTRLFVMPAEAGNVEPGAVIVVGSNIQERNEAVDHLGDLLLVGGPIALLLAALAGYGALTVALRPVESMRRDADEIHHSAPGRRLPVPPADDEIGRLGHTLNEMLERLEHAFDRERTFVADASHELRTPLAILKAELELAMRPGRSVEELQAAVRSAAEETDRLVQLAEDLLVLARSEQGGLPLRLEPLSPPAVLARTRERFVARAQEQSVDLQVAEATATPVHADATRLAQAIGNLTDNALQHGARHVQLGATDDGDAVRLWVRDDGDGFPDGFIDTAFDRFTRADHARSAGGTGLGLAIVAAIADAHGGQAGARNQPSGGSEVWITIPRRSPA